MGHPALAREGDTADPSASLGIKEAARGLKDGPCFYGVSAFKTKTSKERAVTP
jgi:hypothetical protein